jgi:hypothetical protein
MSSSSCSGLKGSFGHFLEFQCCQIEPLAYLAKLVLAGQSDGSSEILRCPHSHVPISELWLSHDTQFFLEAAFCGPHSVLIEELAFLFSQVFIAHPVLPELLIMP